MRAEAVGFYRGEDAERGQLMTRFSAVIANYRAFVRRTLVFLGWNRSMNQIVDPLPTVVQAPRLFAGEIDFGDVTQSSSAFLSVHDSLSFFRAVYDSFAELPGGASSASTGWSPPTKRQGSYRL